MERERIGLPEINDAGLLYEKLFPVPNEWRGMGAHKARIESDVKHQFARDNFLFPVILKRLNNRH